jgi:hypothetical protein
MRKYIIVSFFIVFFVDFDAKNDKNVQPKIFVQKNLW